MPLPLSITHMYVMLRYLYVFTQGSPKTVLFAGISHSDLQWHVSLIIDSPLEQLTSLLDVLGHL